MLIFATYIKMKIFKAVIISFSIYMMYFFVRFEKSVKMFLHHKTMFINIFCDIIGMMRCKYFNVTSRIIFMSSTFPIPMIFSRKFWTNSSFYPRFVPFLKFSFWRDIFTKQSFPITFVRTKFTFVTFIIPKYFFTFFADYFNHIIPSKLKAAFGGLKKTVMFSHLLTAKFFDIRNPFSLSNTSIAQNRRAVK